MSTYLTAVNVKMVLTSTKERGALSVAVLARKKGQRLVKGALLYGKKQCEKSPVSNFKSLSGWLGELAGCLKLVYHVRRL
jgi:hypothetical protein